MAERQLGRRPRFASHDAEFFIISPATRLPAYGTTRPVMGIRNYMGAWMILDNYPWAQVFALDGGNLRQCRMSAPQPNRRSGYGENLWWMRDIEFVPYSRGPVA